MNQPPRFLDEIGAKLAELAANSPIGDIEKNARALLGSAFSKLDQRLADLEHRVAELEAALKQVGPAE
jgi:ubiquinone biosynthesis accessory factor UbiK